MVLLWLEEDKKCPGGLWCPCWAQEGCALRTWLPEGTVPAFGLVFLIAVSILVISLHFREPGPIVISSQEREDMTAQKPQVAWSTLGDGTLAPHRLVPPTLKLFPLSSAGNPSTWLPVAITATQTHGATSQVYVSLSSWLPECPWP